MELNKAIARIQMHIDTDKALISDDINDEFNKFVKEDIEALETVLMALDDYKTHCDEFMVELHGVIDEEG